MKTNLVDIGLKDAEGNPTPVWDGVPSATSTPEIAAQSGAFSVTGGSLPVSSVNLLIYRWEERARDHRQIAASNDSKIMAAAHTVIADRWDEAVNDLRAEMVRAMVRQPEENSVSATPR